MKDKLYNALQTFSRAIIQPVMFMAVAGIVIAISVIFTLEPMPAFLNTFGDFLFAAMNDGVIGNLPVIFAVGIATALVPDEKTDTAVLAITVFMIFLVTNNFWLDYTGRLAEAGEHGLFGTGQNTVLGFQVTDMGVFTGIIIGVLTGVIVNKFKDVKFHEYIQIYEGTKFAFVILIIITSLFAIGITYIWPFVNDAITKLVNWMTSAGALGFFGYGFVNRMTLPFGLHHLLWLPVSYTPLGGSAVINGESVSGAMNIWLAQLGNISEVTSIHPSIGYLTNFGNMALPLGISLAFIKTARKENRKKVMAILIPAVITAGVAGITEPIEFLFLFTAPVLWLGHAFVYGLGHFLSNVFGLKIIVGKLIETVLYSVSVPMELGRQWLIPIIFVILVALEYIIFVFLIERYDLDTLGRGDIMEDSEEDEQKKSENELKPEKSEGVNDSSAMLSLIIDGLGGPNNIKQVENCFTRLRINVKDEELIDKEILDEYPARGVVVRGSNVQMIIGLEVGDLRKSLEQELSKY